MTIINTIDIHAPYQKLSAIPHSPIVPKDLCVLTPSTLVPGYLELPKRRGRRYHSTLDYGKMQSLSVIPEHSFSIQYFVSK